MSHGKFTRMGARDCAKEVVTIIEMDNGLRTCPNKDIDMLETWFLMSRAAGWVQSPGELELLAIGEETERYNVLSEKMRFYHLIDRKLEEISNNLWGDAAPNPAETWRQEP